MNIFRRFALSTCAITMSLFSSAISAAPQVGDYVVLEGTVSFNGQESAVSTRVENIQFNEANETMLVRTTEVMQGNTEVSEGWTKTSELMDQESATYVAATACAQDPEGVLENITTPVGNFNTCKLPLQEDSITGFFWVGPVPGGIVKGEFVETEGNNQFHFKYLLKEFAWK